MYLNIIKIEKDIEKYLDDNGLIPFSILYSNLENNFLKISFFLPDDMEKFKRLLDYDSVCDKSGFLEFPSNTVILSGLILDRFLKLI